MSEHVTSEAVKRLENGDAGRDEALFILRHLSDCAECRTFASPSGDDAARVLSVFVDALREPAQHLGYDSGIVAYAEGALGPAERELVESHIEECERCRIDLEDIVSIQRAGDKRATASPGLRAWPVAAAIMVPLVAAAILWVAVERPAQRSASHGPAMTPSRPAIAHEAVPTYRDSEWTALVATALAEGRLPVSPHLLALRDEPGRIRGEASATEARLDPAGEVIDSVRPHFHWSSSEKGAAVVAIFDEDGTEVARSARLRRSDWICNRSLQRGETYVWQVNVMLDDGRQVVLPVPPAPIARFHIISEQEHDSVLTAARQYPDDHVLLAVLYARNGMEKDAEKQLRLAAGTKHSASVERLLAGTFGPRSSSP